MNTRNTKQMEELITKMIPTTEEERSINMKDILRNLNERCDDMNETQILIKNHDRRHEANDHLKKLKASKDLKKTLKLLEEKQEEAVIIQSTIGALQREAEDLYDNIIFSSCINKKEKN